MPPNNPYGPSPRPELHRESRFFGLGGSKPQPQGSGGVKPRGNAPYQNNLGPSERPGVHKFGADGFLSRLGNLFPKKLATILLLSSAYGAVMGELPRAYESGNSAAREMLSRPDIVAGLNVASPSENPESAAHHVVEVAGSGVVNFLTRNGTAFVLGGLNGMSEGVGKVELCHRKVDFNPVSLPALPANTVMGAIGGITAIFQGGYSSSEMSAIFNKCSQVPGPWDNLAPASGTPTRQSTRPGFAP